MQCEVAVSYTLRPESVILFVLVRTAGSLLTPLLVRWRIISLVGVVGARRFSSSARPSTSHLTNALFSRLEEWLLKVLELLDHMPYSVGHGLDRRSVQLQVDVFIYHPAVALVAVPLPLFATLSQKFEGRSFFQELLPQIREVGTNLVFGFGQCRKILPDDLDEGAQGKSERN